MLEKSPFDDVAAEYDAIRPTYPPDVFDEIAAFAGKDRLDVLEVAPGTGQATRSMAERGWRITAVELGPNLAQRTRENMATFPAVTVITGAFETAQLPVAAFDVIFCSCAWHWIEQPAGFEKAARLLRPGGVIALLALVQVRAEREPDFFVESQPIHMEAEAAKYREPDWGPPRREVTSPHAPGITESGLFGPVHEWRCDWDHEYTTREYETLVRSYSNITAMEPEARERLNAGLCKLADEQFGGRVLRPMVLTLALAKRK